MEKTEKTKRVLTVSVIALLALALVSMCFVFSTMARYTTGGTGTGTTPIAKWDVSMGDKTTLDVTIDKLSPSEKSNETSGRTNRTIKDVVTITSTDTDVDVEVLLNTIASTNLKFYKAGADAATPVEITSSDEIFGDSGYTLTDLQSLFTVTYTDASGTALTEENLKFAKNTEKSLTVYVTVTWKSRDGVDGDKLDTWVGQNVVSLGFDMVITAVQSSKLPA